MSLRRNLSKYLTLYNYVEAYRSNRLPEGYTKLSYIRGDGNAYIDLGIKLTQNDNVDIALELPSNLNSQNIFGYRSSASAQNIMLFIASTDNNLGIDCNNSNYSTYRLIQQISINTKYDIIISKDRRAVYQGDTLIGENTAVCSDEILTDNVYLFFGNGSTAYSNAKFTGKIYSAKISDRMDLIPCKDPNNNIGMYDIVSRKFFGNSADSGAFVAGDEIADDYLGFNTVKLKDAIHGKLNELTVYGKTKNKSVDGLDSLVANGGTELIPETYLDTVIAKGKCVQENRLTNGLPGEYQELYYIQTDINSYIDTGIAGNASGNRYKVGFSRISVNGSSCNGIIGTHNITEPYGRSYVGSRTNYWEYGYGVSTTGGSISNNTYYDIDLDTTGGKYVLNINGINQVTQTNTEARSTAHILINTVYNATSTYTGIAKYYYVQIYDNGSIIMNLIPARRKSDSEIGMYDTVSKTFLTNSGTGTFTASEDKLVDDTASKYTKVNGVTNINSTLFNTGIYADVDDMEFIVKVTPSLGSFYILQARGGSTGSNINGISGSTSGSTIIGAMGAALPSGVVSSAGSRDTTHTYIIDWKHKNGVATLTVNDLTAGTSFVDSATYNTSDFVPSGNPIGVFGNFNGDRIAAGNTLYYAKVYKQGKLVVDYIPTTTTVNDITIPGFFDRVTGTFKKPEDCGYSNDTLTPGSALTTEIPDPYNPVDIWCNNGKVGNNLVPNIYQQVEYLESDGNQYLDLERVPNNTDIIEQKFQKKGTNAATCSWYGSMPSSSTIFPRIGIGSFSSQSVATIFAGSNYTGMIGAADTNVHTLRFQATGEKELTYTLDGVTSVIDASGATAPQNFYEPAVELTSYLFARHGSDGVQTYDNEGTKIYSHKEWLNNGTLVMNLVPVRRISDNTLGMYDTVSKKFFTNLGTGTFVAGSNVYTSDIQEVITAPNGKNLFDKNNIQRIYGYFPSSNANWTYAPNGNSIKIPCKSNTTYTATYDGEYSIVVLGFGSTYSNDEPSANNTGVPITTSIRQNSPTKSTPVTITTGVNDKWLIVAWPANELYPDQYEEIRQHLIVEEGSSFTSYEVGKGFNTAGCENLLNVGAYQDTQSVLDGVVTRKVGIKVFTGNETWTQMTSDRGYYTMIPETNGLPMSSTDLNMWCSHYQFEFWTPPQSTETHIGVNKVSFNGSTSGTNGNVTVRPDLTKYNTEEKWTAFLAEQYANGTPVILVYPIATATENVETSALNKKEVSVISGSLSISNLEVTSTESEHTIPTPSQPLSLRCNNGTIVTKFHNDDYTRLEYVESTDRLPAINTGARYSAGNDFIVEWSAVDTESQINGATLFAATSVSPFSGGLYGKNTSRSYYIGNTGTGQSGLVGYASDDSLVHNWKIVVKNTKMDLYKDGTRVGGIDNISGTIDTEHDIYLFCGGWTNTSDQTLTQFSRWRLYSWKLTVAGTVVRDLVPAKRNEDNELGMYDKVTDTFFINCATGSFVGGNITTDVEGTQETIITVKETNLFNNDTTPIINAYVNANNGTLTAGTPGSSTQYSFVIPCKSNITYKLDGMTALSGWGSFTDSTIGTVATVFTKGNDTLTTGPNDQYLIGMVYATGTSYDYRNTLDIREMDIMAYVENLLASGTYADTQDILTGLVTHNLGVWVLTGAEEGWNYYDVQKIFYCNTLKFKRDNNFVSFCTHYKGMDYSRITDLTLNNVVYTSYVSTTEGVFAFRDLRFDNTKMTEWKSFLADQYAKGTPVIILYPLATATTESVDAQEMRNSPASIKDASMEGLTLTQTHSIHTAPTPAFPLDLVCNNGVIKGVSKNLFDPAENNITVGYWLRNSDGNPESSPANYYYNDFMPVKPNTNYVFFGRKKSDGTLSNYNRIAWYDSSKTWIRNSTYTQGTIGTDTSPANAAFARISCNIDGSTLTTDYVLQFNWMFYEGTEEESFVPYGVLVEGNPEKLNIKGKNLFNKNGNLKTGTYRADNGAWVDNESFRTLDYIPGKPGVSYTLSAESTSETGGNAFSVQAWDSTHTNWLGTVASSTAQNIQYASGISPAGTAYLSVSFAPSYRDINTLQLEEGPRPTQYEEYMNVDYLVPTLLSMDNYIDTQELQSGVKNTRVGVRVLNGTEEWNSGSVTTAYTSPCWDTPLQTDPDRIEIYSTHFKGTDVTNANMPNNTIKLTNSSLFSGNACMVIKGNDYPTAADFKAYLAAQYATGTPVIVVYPLANTITETEESKHIQIDAGTNEISRISDSGVGDLEMEVKYKKLK